MGWSESYYRDFLDQTEREWKARASGLVELADRFFNDLSDGQEHLPLPDEELARCLRLWEGLRDTLRRDFNI